MKLRVLAFVDESPMVPNVVTMATTLGNVFAAEVEAVHIGPDVSEELQAATRDTGVPLRCEPGHAPDQIVAEIEDEGVVAGVLGARQLPANARPAGHIALDVITRVDRLVAVVPPEARVPDPGELRRVLIPLDGREASADAVRRLCEACTSSGIDVIVLHVFDAETTPRFWDQPQYEAEAWGDEFLARFMEKSGASVRLRSGMPQEWVPDMAYEEDVDAIALAWAQHLDPGRASVVRRVLVEAPVPILLLPSTPPVEAVEGFSRTESAP